MATSRSGNGKKKTTSSSRSSSKSKAGTKGRSASASSRKTQPSRRAQRRAQTTNLRRSVVLAGIGLMVIALALIKGTDGLFWNTLHNGLFGVFGLIGYLLGPFLLYLAYLLASGYRVEIFTAKTMLLALLLDSVPVVFSKFTIGESTPWDVIKMLYAWGSTRFWAGGVLGGPVGAVLLALCGRPASNIIMLLILAMGLMVYFAVTPVDVVQFVSYYLEQGRLAREARREEERAYDTQLFQGEPDEEPLENLTGTLPDAPQYQPSYPAAMKQRPVFDLEKEVHRAGVPASAAVPPSASFSGDSRAGFDVDLGPSAPEQALKKAIEHDPLEPVVIGPGGTFGMDPLQHLSNTQPEPEPQPPEAFELHLDADAPPEQPTEADEIDALIDRAMNDYPQGVSSEVRLDLPETQDFSTPLSAASAGPASASRSAYETTLQPVAQADPYDTPFAADASFSAPAPVYGDPQPVPQSYGSSFSARVPNGANPSRPRAGAVWTAGADAQRAVGAGDDLSGFDGAIHPAEDAEPVTMQELDMTGRVAGDTVVLSPEELRAAARVAETGEGSPQTGAPSCRSAADSAAFVPEAPAAPAVPAAPAQETCAIPTIGGSFESYDTVRQAWNAGIPLSEVLSGRTAVPETPAPVTASATYTSVQTGPAVPAAAPVQNVQPACAAPAAPQSAYAAAAASIVAAQADRLNETPPADRTARPASGAMPPPPAYNVGASVVAGLDPMAAGRPQVIRRSEDPFAPPPQRGESARLRVEETRGNSGTPPVSGPVNADKVSPEAAALAEALKEPAKPYCYPSLNLFNAARPEDEAGAVREMKKNADILVNTLDSFGVKTKILDICRGPSVTRYELQPQAGIKVSRITSLADDIALNLATAGVRIEAPIPGKPAVGIEVPNKIRSTVSIRSVFESQNYINMRSPLTMALGKDIAGAAQVADLCKMPHLLIAGSTGSGKSVCVNSIIISFLFRSSPEDVKLILIDPKVVELAEYNGIPHLLMPVVTEPRKAAGALGASVAEMERRYKLFAENNVREIKAYNRLAAKNPALDHMPYIAIVIDELADLMMVAGKEVEDYICRIAQKARAAGIHLIVATQRPSVDVITGLIKANIPSRVAFSVSSQIDSRTILDTAGAEKLLGNGDMLFLPVGASKPIRVQGTFVTDEEIGAVLDFIKSTSDAQYDEEMIAEMERRAVAEKGGKKGADADEDAGGALDPMFEQAVECVIEAGQASTSLLQRRCKLGYARAARIMDQMEQEKIIGPYEGAKPRAVLVTQSQWQERKLNGEYDG